MPPGQSRTAPRQTGQSRAGGSLVIADGVTKSWDGSNLWTLDRGTATRDGDGEAGHRTLRRQWVTGRAQREGGRENKNGF